MYFCLLQILPRLRILFNRCECLVIILMLSISFPQDWLDIDFGIAEGVDFIAISFVKSADVITHLKSYIKARARDRYEYM